METRLPSFKIKYPPLSKEELNELVLKAQRGCQESRNTVIERNLGLVSSDAYKMSKFNNTLLSFEDLYQEGVISLVTAVNKFDPSKGFAFSTYAKWWIRQAIGRYIHDHKSLIRTPVYASEIRFRYETLKKENYERDEEEILEQVSKEKKHTLKTVRWIVDNRNSFESIDKIIHEENGRSKQISAELFEDDFTALDYDYVKGILEYLPSRDSRILTRYYQGYTLEKVGVEENLSRESIRLIVKSSLRKLKALIKLQKIKEL